MHTLDFLNQIMIQKRAVGPDELPNAVLRYIGFVKYDVNPCRNVTITPNYSFHTMTYSIPHLCNNKKKSVVCRRLMFPLLVHILRDAAPNPFSSRSFAKNQHIKYIDIISNIF